MANPESAAAGVTYPNRDAMDFGDSGTVYPVRALLGGAVHNLRIKFSLDRHQQCGVSFDCPSNIEPAPGEPTAIFGVKPDVIQSTPNFGVGFTPSETHSSSKATRQIPWTNLRKNKILVGSFKQVGGGADLAPPDLIPSKNALPVGFA
jgi:hypothetical protein